MSSQKLTINCPKCQMEISLDEVLTQDLKAKATLEAKELLDAEKQELREKMAVWKKQEEEKLHELLKKKEEEESQELKILKEENEKKSLKLREAQELELKLRQEKNAVEE